MFRPGRSPSTRRLWRQRCGTLSRGSGEGSGPAPEEPPNGLRPAALQLFKKLRDEQLWRLAEAVESRGRWDCGCVWYPLEVRLGKPAPPPQVLLCKLYRWPDLRSPAELKRLLHCEDYGKKNPEGPAVCCNPFHYSRLLPPDPAAPLPYKTWEPPRPAHPITHPGSAFCHTHAPHDTTLSRGSRWDGHWCKLAYWEHRTRVGRLFSVSEAAVHVFQELPQGSGFCLGLLGVAARSPAVRRTRTKIGQGLTLSREQGDVWAYNRSEHPLFISSPTLARRTPVCRLPPGYSAKVFDAQLAEESFSCGPVLGEGPCDPHSVRISFAKGWGPCYSRQFITSCPCWLEILLCTM